MTTPTARLAALRASTSAFVHSLDPTKWSDEYVHAPSLLPSWSRGHVLTHLARNADGINRALSGALRGEIVARYPDGTAGRNADIEAGASRASTEILNDVSESALRLDRVFAAVAEADAWDRPTEDHPVGFYAAARWREVEIHRVDLGAEYLASDWPSDFVAYLLPELVDGLIGRAGQPMRIEVTVDGSRAPELGGQTWRFGEGESADVTGPDWALLAWLAGRPVAAESALGELPELPAWL